MVKTFIQLSHSYVVIFLSSEMSLRQYYTVLLQFYDYFQTNPSRYWLIEIYFCEPIFTA